MGTNDRQDIISDNTNNRGNSSPLSRTFGTTSSLMIKIRRRRYSSLQPADTDLVLNSNLFDK